MRTYWEGTGNSSQFSVMTCMGRESRKEGIYAYTWASLVAQMVKNPPAMQKTWFRSLCWEDLLEKGMATHSSISAWRIPWTEEPGGLQSMGSQRVRHNWTANTFIKTPSFKERKERRSLWFFLNAAKLPGLIVCFLSSNENQPLLNQSLVQNPWESGVYKHFFYGNTQIVSEWSVEWW